MIEPMLIVQRVTKEQFAALHRKMLELARADEDCRLLMTAPGVGTVVAMTYRAVIDEPARFRRSRAVGAHFGLVPRTYQSGEIDRRSRITYPSGDGRSRLACRGRLTLPALAMVQAPWFALMPRAKRWGRFTF